MTPTTYQTPEIRDSNDNIVKQGSFGKNTALSNSTNDGWIDYVANDLEFLYGLAKDEVVPVSELPSTGDTNKTYLLTTTGVCYRWSGTEWVAVSSSEAVGRAETAASLAEQWATKTSGTVDGTEYSAKYYAEQAQDTADDLSESLEQIATNTANIEENAENIATNTGNIAQNTTDIDIAEKRIGNIEKLLQGNLYDYQTDSTSAYTKTVPAGAMPYASLNSIGGKTIVWNQTFVLSILRGDTTSYGVTSERTDNGIRLYGAFTSGVNLPVFNSWYGAIIGHKYLIANTPVSEALTLRLTQNGTYVNWQENTPFTATDTHTYLAIRAITTGVTFDVTWTPQIFDLTLMFGAGNEPTTYAEFQQMFPASYYPYNAGTMLSAGVTEVVSKKVDNTEIAAYPIPAEVRALSGYGWSAGNAYNYINFERKVFVKNVDRVDLGTLTWGSSSSGGKKYFFSSSLSSEIKYVSGSNGAVNNIIYPYGSTGSFLNAYNGAFNCIGVGGSLVNTGRIAIYDSTKEEMTNAEFKASVSGVYAYYELATPQEIDISAYLTDDNLIEVEAGGTLTFENQHGDDYRIPIPSAETYMVDLQASL